MTTQPDSFKTNFYLHYFISTNIEFIIAILRIDSQYRNTIFQNLTFHYYCIQSQESHLSSIQYNPHLSTTDAALEAGQYAELVLAM